MYRVLFVCLGNICRSPAAEGVFARYAKEMGIKALEYDSAGTSGHHDGELPDHRMRERAAKRGHKLNSRSRKINNSDFQKFDLILAMDNSNLEDLRRICPNEFKAKVKLFSEFFENRTEVEVPDPYYGGTEGFDLVLDIVEDGARGLIQYIKGNIHVG